MLSPSEFVGYFYHHHEGLSFPCPSQAQPSQSWLVHTFHGQLQSPCPRPAPLVLNILLGRESQVPRTAGPLTPFPGRCWVWRWTAPPSSPSRGKSSDPSKERGQSDHRTPSKSACWHPETVRDDCTPTVTSGLQRAFPATVLFDPHDTPGRRDRADAIIPTESMKKPRLRGAKGFAEGLSAGWRSQDFRFFHNMMLVTGNTGFRKACLTTRVTSVTTPHESWTVSPPKFTSTHSAFPVQGVQV